MKCLWKAIKFNILKFRMRFIIRNRLLIVILNHNFFFHKQTFRRITYKFKNKLRKYIKILIKTHNKIQPEKVYFKELVHLYVIAFLVIKKNILSLWIAYRKIKSKNKIFSTKIKNNIWEFILFIKHTNKIKRFYKLFRIEMKKWVK